MIFSRHIITVASLGLIMAAPLPSIMDFITPDAQAQPSRNASKNAKKLKAKNKKKLKELNKGLKNIDRAYATAAGNLFRAEYNFQNATGNAQVEARTRLNDASAKYNLVIDQGRGLRAQKQGIILSQHSSRISRFQRIKNRLFNNRNTRLQEAPAPVPAGPILRLPGINAPGVARDISFRVARRNGYADIPPELQGGNSRAPAARNGYVLLSPIRNALNHGYSLAPHPQGAGYGSIPSGVRQVSNYGAISSRVNRQSVEFSPLNPDE